MKKTFLGIITLCIVAVACTKNDTTTSQNEIIGKWTLNKVISWEIGDSTYGVPGVKNWDTTLYASNSYVDFRTDGKIYFKSVALPNNQVNYDTANYSVSNNFLYSTNIYGTDTLSIKELTANKLTLSIESAKYGSTSYLTK